MDAFVWRRQGPWWLEGSRAASAVASIPAPVTPVLASVQSRVASIVASAVIPASSTPVRCGELLCQHDSYARTLDTVVVSCEPKAAQEAAAKGKKKGGAEAAPAEQLWDVVLSNTVIFPEGGGQPSDCGTVGGVPCLRVDNVDGLAKHVLTAPLAPGTPVTVAVEWARREDHMAQHSTQHLVTAIALKKWGFETTSWGLGEQTSFLELGTPEFTSAQMMELETAANEAVKAGTPVTPSWHSVAAVNEGAVAGLRKSSKALPPSVTGPVRVVSFEGIDTNTCCGTHVQNTARLQAIKLLRVERVGNKGACRVHYVAGGRVVSYLGGAYERASALASRMNVPIESMLERYEENARKALEHEKASKALALEVVGLLVEGLLQRLSAGEKAVLVRRAAADADFVKALATALDETLAAKQALLLVVVGEGEGEGTFTLAGPPALVDVASGAGAQALDGRGGGKGGRYQGKCQKLAGASEALAAAVAALA